MTADRAEEPGLLKRLDEVVSAGALVSRLRSSVQKSVGDFRRSQGATTTNIGQYSEEEQRSERRKAPRNSVANF
jgi:hypothetical protein